MYCKFCGNPINRETMDCTFCGKPVGPLSDGNSFAKLLQMQSDGMIPSTVHIKHASQPSQIEPDVRRNKSTKLNSISTLASLCCVLLSMIILVSLFLQSSKFIRTIERAGVSASSQLSELNQQISDVEASIKSEPDMPNMPDVPDMPNVNLLDVLIEKDPESVTNVTRNRTNVAFICRASGDGLKFSWIKYDPSQNTWIEVKEDNPLFKVDSSANETSLSIINASDEHEGTYLCVIEDQNGHYYYSSPAQISLAIDSVQSSTVPND